MASTSCKIATFSAVISPKIRMARPGPGNGWRFRMFSGSSNERPTARTSSLKRVLSGSTIFNFMKSGNPPTLWCDLMVAEGPFTETDSITSG